MTRRDTHSRVVQVQVSGSPTIVIVVVRNVVSSTVENSGIPQLPHTPRSCADRRMCPTVHVQRRLSLVSACIVVGSRRSPETTRKKIFRRHQSAWGIYTQHRAGGVNVSYGGATMAGAGPPVLQRRASTVAGPPYQRALQDRPNTAVRRASKSHLNRCGATRRTTPRS